MRKNLWMLAVILICGTMTMLTSCSVSDNPVDNTQATRTRLTAYHDAIYRHQLRIVI